MIATLTLNPAIDKIAHVDKLIVGDLNRLSDVKTTIGGKGINVARTLRALNERTEVFTVTAGTAGMLVEQYLRSNYYMAHIVKAEGNTRTNIKIIEADGSLTEINDAGPTVSKEMLNLLTIKMVKSLKKGDTIILSGSLPDSVPTTIYRDLIEKVKAAGIYTILDADGEPFREGVSALPDIVKPNVRELRGYFGVTEQIDEKETSLLAQKLTRLGIGLVAASMGHQGAVFASADHAYFAKAVNVHTDSTVGAGDAMVGAIAYARHAGYDDEKLIRLSMAASAAACTSHGVNMDIVEKLMDEVEITRI